MKDQTNIEYATEAMYSRPPHGHMTADIDELSNEATNGQRHRISRDQRERDCLQRNGLQFYRGSN